MSVKLSVVESYGKKVFDWSGLKIDSPITATFFDGQETAIEIYRDGQLIEIGHFGSVVPGGSLNFSGFKHTDFLAVHFFSGLHVSCFHLGDELILSALAEDIFLNQLCEIFMKRNFDWRQKLNESFPYPLDWDAHLSEMSSIYDRRFQTTLAAVKSGELSEMIFPFGRFGHKRAKKRISIKVVSHSRRKWFEFDDIRFDSLPLLGCFIGLPESPTIEVEVWRGKKRQCRLTVATIGTVCEIMGYYSVNEEATPFLNGDIISEYLLPSNFLVGDRVVLVSPIEVDLVSELLLEMPNIDSSIPSGINLAYKTILDGTIGKDKVLSPEVALDALAQYGDARDAVIKELAACKAINPIILRQRTPMK